MSKNFEYKIIDSRCLMYRFVSDQTNLFRVRHKANKLMLFNIRGTTKEYILGSLKVSNYEF